MSGQLAATQWGDWENDALPGKTSLFNFLCGFQVTQWKVNAHRIHFWRRRKPWRSAPLRFEEEYGAHIMGAGWSCGFCPRPWFCSQPMDRRLIVSSAYWNAQHSSSSSSDDKLCLWFCYDQSYIRGRCWSFVAEKKLFSHFFPANVVQHQTHI